MNDIQLKQIEFVAKFMAVHYEQFIKPLYYEHDYKNLDLSGIDDVDNWEMVEFFNEVEDDYIAEIDDIEEAYDLSAKLHHLNGSNVAYKYGYAFTKSDDEIGFYVLTMKDGTHYVGDYCSD